MFYSTQCTPFSYNWTRARARVRFKWTISWYKYTVQMRTLNYYNVPNQWPCFCRLGKCKLGTFVCAGFELIKAYSLAQSRHFKYHIMKPITIDSKLLIVNSYTNYHTHKTLQDKTNTKKPTTAGKKNSKSNQISGLKHLATWWMWRLFFWLKPTLHTGQMNGRSLRCTPSTCLFKLWEPANLLLHRLHTELRSEKWNLLPSAHF